MVDDAIRLQMHARTIPPPKRGLDCHIHVTVRLDECVGVAERVSLILGVIVIVMVSVLVGVELSDAVLVAETVVVPLAVGVGDGVG